MSFIEDLFIDVKELPNTGYGFFQVIFLGMVYGFVLYKASNLISDGSELLLLIPALAGIIGSVVLPVLGAVPDSMMILFSGLGDDAQEQLSVGVGALAGSTIMLLSLSWGLATIAGRVSLSEDGTPNYGRPRDADPNTWSKLKEEDKWSVVRSGVSPGREISVNAGVMLATAAIYLIIQVPALKSTGTKARDKALDPEKASKQQTTYALAGMILCFLFFVGYLTWNTYSASHQEVLKEYVEELNIEAIKQKTLSLSTVMAGELMRLQKQSTEETPLQRLDMKRLQTILRPFYRKHDVNMDGRLSPEEVRSVLREMGEEPSDVALQEWVQRADLDGSGYIEFHEFVEATANYLIKAMEDPSYKRAVGSRRKLQPESSAYMLPESLPVRKVESGGVKSTKEEPEEEEEEEEVPEDLQHLPPNVQRRKILMRSFGMMGLGALIVLVFSDPMVNVLSEVGKRTGVSSFYISFIFSPLASNASEIIAAHSYAAKKTKRSITISYATLLGAACMNNTLGLGIFLALIRFRGLFWEFTAETIAILFVEIFMGFIAFRQTVRLLDGYIILSLFLVSLVLVAFLEKVVGLD